ncbi:MAG: hypothetical protein IKD93_06720, partial [Firmicutes bacterium]|nr:hypothetical protein [Bacillota bacterium]
MSEYVSHDYDKPPRGGEPSALAGSERLLEPVSEPVSSGTVRTAERGAALPLPLIAVIVMLLAVLGLGGWYLMSHRTAATVYMDVNPSVALSVDGKDKVLKAEGVNEDGESVIDGLTLKGLPVSTAVDRVVESLLDQGYLTADESLVLLSVSGRDDGKVNSLRRRLAKQITQSVGEAVGSAAVFDQALPADSDLKELSEKLDVSLGKASLIRLLSAQNSKLDKQLLAGMTLGELQTYLDRKGIDLQGYARMSGTVAQADAKPAKTDSKTDNKTDSKTDNKTDNKTDDKTDAKTEDQAETASAASPSYGFSTYSGSSGSSGYSNYSGGAGYSSYSSSSGSSGSSSSSSSGSSSSSSSGNSSSGS